MKGNSRGMKSDMMCNHDCHGGMWSKCYGSKWFIIGLIFLINAYWPFADWWMLIGWLLVISGVMKWIMPHCGHYK